MRSSRKKVLGKGCYYHVMNRVTGVKGECPFTEVDKEKGFKIIAQLSKYFLVEIISACWMGNHYHIVLYVPGHDESITSKEAGIRHSNYYGNKSCLDLNSEDACSKVLDKMLNLSEFMGLFQQHYTYHINRTHNRLGRLWADRFKSVIIEGNDALWKCVKYIELNSVRAGLTETPEEYRFCSWGRYNGTDKHPFHKSFLKHMKRSLGELGTSMSSDDLYAEFRSALARIIASEKGLSSEEIFKAASDARRAKESMPMRFLRRTRHWTDGAIIGTKAFVTEISIETGYRTGKEAKEKQYSKGISEGVSLFCYRRLQNL